MGEEKERKAKKFMMVKSARMNQNSRSAKRRRLKPVFEVSADSVKSEVKRDGSPGNVLTQLRTQKNRFYDPSNLFSKDYIPPKILPGHEPHDPLRPRRQRNVKAPSDSFRKHMHAKPPTVSDMQNRYKGKEMPYKPSNLDGCTKRVRKRR